MAKLYVRLDGDWKEIYTSGAPASIDHGALTGLGDDDHTQYQKESEKGAASGYASLNASTKVVEDPANATTTPTASKIPIADGSGTLDDWVTSGAGNPLTEDLDFAGYQAANLALEKLAGEPTPEAQAEIIYDTDDDKVKVCTVKGGSLTLTLRPNAAGDATELTKSSGAANWEMVDEAVADEGTTYVYIASGTDKNDLYNLPAHTIETGTITNVEVTVRVMKNGAYNGCTAWPMLSTGGTEYVGTEVALTNGVWADLDDDWAVNPKTGIAWTWDDIDALQIGVRLYDQFASHAPECTQVYAIVSYTEDTSWEIVAYESKVLLLDNTTEFTPDADYEPATKKYVDDNAGISEGTVIALILGLGG